MGAPVELKPAIDRAPPPRVAPVERAGIRYSQAEDGRDVGEDRADGVLVATDVKTGQRLWTLAVYRTPRVAGLEDDAQWRFFTRMAFDRNGQLRIINEANQTFLVDVAARTVSP